MIPVSTSAGSLSEGGESVSTERFKYKAAKFRSISKSNLCFSALKSSVADTIHQGDPMEAANDNIEEGSREEDNAPVLIREKSIDLLKRRLKAKPTHSLELNIFHRYKNKSPRLHIHSTYSDPPSSNVSGFLLLKPKGRRPKRRWNIFNGESIQCYRAAMVSLLQRFAAKFNGFG